MTSLDSIETHVEWIKNALEKQQSEMRALREEIHQIRLSIVKIVSFAAGASAIVGFASGFMFG